MSRSLGGRLCPPIVWQPAAAANTTAQRHSIDVVFMGSPLRGTVTVDGAYGRSRIGQKQLLGFLYLSHLSNVFLREHEPRSLPAHD
jgi:hypothetical protein